MPVLASRAALALAALVCLAACGAEPPRPDLLLVTVDTLRADHLGAYRELRPTPPGEVPLETPALDALAASSRVHVEAWTPVPITTAALGSMLTGELPRHHGALNNAGDLAPDVETVVMALDAAGYDTAAFLPTFLGDKPGFRRGFDLYDVPRLGTPARSGSEVVGRALAWLDAREAAGTDTPAFLWVHLFDPHAPYAPGPVLERRHLGERAAAIPPDLRDEVFLTPEAAADHDLDVVRGLYRGDVELTDAALAPLVERILARPSGARERVTILTADHGEHLAERAPYVGHTGYLFDEMLRVPFLLHSSTGAIAPGRSDYPASLTDVAATLAAHAGLGGSWGLASGAVPLGLEELDAHLAATPGGGAGARFLVHETFAPEGFHDQRAVRLGDHALVIDTAPERPMALFRRDGAEVVDLGDDEASWSAADRAAYARLVAFHASWLRETAPVRRVERELGADEAAGLEAMGYVGGDAGADG